MNDTADIRQDVAAACVSCEPSDNIKELFPEEYAKSLKKRKWGRRKPAPFKN